MSPVRSLGPIRVNFNEPSPQREPSSRPRREGAGPPSTLGEGGLVYGRRRDGSGLTGLGMGPTRGDSGLKLVGEWDEGIGRVGCWELLRGGGERETGQAGRPTPPPPPPPHHPPPAGGGGGGGGDPLVVHPSK